MNSMRSKSRRGDVCFGMSQGQSRRREFTNGKMHTVCDGWRMQTRPKKLHRLSSTLHGEKEQVPRKIVGRPVPSAGSHDNVEWHFMGQDISVGKEETVILQPMEYIAETDLLRGWILTVTRKPASMMFTAGKPQSTPLICTGAKKSTLY